VSPRNVLPCASSTDQDRSRLRFTVQVSSRRQAARLAAELRTMAADVVRVHAPAPHLPGRRDWTVALTTPPLSLTLAVVQPLEREMLAVEHRWPGSHFLGWKTCSTPQRSIGGTERESDRDVAGVRRRQTQRELVTASLLRCAPEERGIVHGRGAPR
jgi:hypothetical protein